MSEPSSTNATPSSAETRETAALTGSGELRHGVQAITTTGVPAGYEPPSAALLQPTASEPAPAPEKYDDLLPPELRRELAVWRAATGVPVDERTMVGPLPHDDREVAYHRNLTGRINARYGEAVKTWADRIVKYVGKRDQQTGELAKYLDTLARKGIDAERVLRHAAARKPLPVDHPTAALGYRVKDLVTPRRQCRAVPSIDPFPRSPQHDSGPSLGM